jgi:hypothetical protein
MRGYSTNADGDVVLTMDRRDYETVLLALGYATGGEMMPRRSMVELMNRLRFKSTPRNQPNLHKNNRLDLIARVRNTACLVPFSSH